MYTNTCRILTPPDGLRGVEYTRSWRTGSESRRHYGREQIASNPPIRKKGEGVYAFRQRVNRYYAEIRDNFRGSEHQRGDSALTSDSGHSFHNVKFFRSDSNAISWNTRGERRAHFNVHHAIGYLTRDMPGHRKSDFASTSQDGYFKPPGSLLGPQLHMKSFALEDNHLAKVDQQVSNMLTSSIPGSGSLGFGETIVELARGNFPSVIADLRARVKQGRQLDPKGYGKDLGSEYLNIRFGIEPIIQDFLALVKHLQGTHELLYDTVKRQRSTRLISDTTVESLAVANVLNAGTHKVRYNAYTDVRLKAKYAKIRPNKHSEDFYAESFEILHTFGFNPKLAWDLIPFSWLVDWFGNIGSRITAATLLNPGTGTYKVVYAWATRKTIIESRMSPFKNEYSRGHGAEVAFPLTSLSVALHRTAVSPFGPNFAFKKLTAYQWSILVALGFATSK